MTKKDYDLIAAAFRAELEALQRELNTGLDRYHHIVGVKLMANRLAHRLVGTNPRYDPNRFLEACGVKPQLI